MRNLLLVTLLLLCQTGCAHRIPRYVADADVPPLPPETPEERLRRIDAEAYNARNVAIGMEQSAQFGARLLNTVDQRETQRKLDQILQNQKR